MAQTPHEKSPISLAGDAIRHISKQGQSATNIEATRVCLTAISTEIDNSTNDIDLQDLTKELGALLFCDALQEVPCVWDDTPSDQIKDYGFTSWNGDRYHVKITISKYGHQRRAFNGISKSEYVIGILLHECMHAYFDLLVCGGRCGNVDCSRISHEEMGKYGHGTAFHLLAKEVEDFISMHFGLRVDVGIGRRDAALSYHRREHIALNDDTMQMCFPGEVLRKVNGSLQFVPKDD